MGQQPRCARFGLEASQELGAGEAGAFGADLMVLTATVRPMTGSVAL